MDTVVPLAALSAAACITSETVQFQATARQRALVLAIASRKPDSRASSEHGEGSNAPSQERYSQLHPGPLADGANAKLHRHSVLVDSDRHQIDVTQLGTQ
jgi:hypothetical protein